MNINSLFQLPADPENLNRRINLPESMQAGVSAQYNLRLATTDEDVRAAQFLRFMVFNLELQEGLESSFATCLDVDPFDAICDHLLVEHRETGELVGTYRLQTGETAARRNGYYSEREFDFTPFERHRTEMIELGRACVHRDHRNMIVVNLLWKGIALFAIAHSARYLIGCSSLTSQDPFVGASAYQLLQPHLASEAWRTVPQPSFACSMDQEADRPPKIPKLLAAYLALGARICGPPALDHEFKTIDFLTVLDLKGVPERVRARFLL